MPIKSGRHTPGEKVFAQEFAAHGDRIRAAKAAGYKFPAQTAQQALARPGVQAEIIRIQTERLATESFALAIDTLHSIMRNEAAPAGARVSAAKVVLDKVLARHEDGRQKEAHEMTAEELDRAIAELRRMASDRAKPVVIDAEPQSEEGVFD